MDAKLKYFYELNMETYEMFEAQDPETGEFDVIFEIDGKKLYAHKFKLCGVSSTFKSMLSERWTTPNEPIQIKDYSFDDFKKFVAFIYSGECEFIHENILVMVDMSEFYNVKVFKKACEDFLLKSEWNLENVFQMLELAYKYSKEDLKQSLLAFISNNLSNFLKTEEFQSLPHFNVLDVVKSNQDTVIPEELFEAVFKRAEKQAMEKEQSDVDLNLNEAIKEELSDILPFFKFKSMKLEFLIKFVVSKSFLFSGNELSDILWARYSESQYTVSFVDINGKIMKGALKCSDNERIFQIIQSKKYKSCITWQYAQKDFCWELQQHLIPAPTSKLIKNDNIKWYLVLSNFGSYIVVKQAIHLTQGDILLAELHAEHGFKCSTNCKIV
uniref:BTB domain-containing protein n=1 Tax=Panagrolaimus sp. ES5 TaxID=591445 RepID=A0AC34F028_9BILA